MDRLLAEHQRIERVAIVAEGPRDEAVVGRIVDGAVQHAIETQQAGLLVQLVLVLAALRNFDDDRERALDRAFVEIAVMPWVHELMLACPSCFHWRRGPPPPRGATLPRSGETSPKPRRRRAPPPRTDADARPQISMSSDSHGRRRLSTGGGALRLRAVQTFRAPARHRRSLGEGVHPAAN